MPAAVDDFLRDLDHPLKAEIEGVRQAILAADPAISEGIKWNAPSFFYKDWFATFHLRAKSGVQIILHRGARVKDVPDAVIDDPAGLLEWLAKDRATVMFGGMTDIETKKAAFSDVIRHWIAWL